MTEEQRLIVLALIQMIMTDQRHPDYERVKDLATMYYRFVTGEDLDEEMVQFTQREDEDAFEQRKDITQHIIPAVVSNLVSVERKVPRSNGMTRVVAYDGDDKNKRTAEFEEILGKFWGNQSLDDWMSVRFLELNDIDPNTFMIIEWEDFDNEKEKASPYPYESKAPEAVMFEYFNNILQYLLDLKRFDTTDFEGHDTQAEKYTLYLKDRTIQAIQIFDKEIRAKLGEDGELKEIDENWYFRKKDGVIFELVFPEEHNLGVVPAFRVGYKRDEATDGRTYVSPYHDAVPYLKKTIKTNSELDLTMCLHAFPQKIITAHECSNEKCNGGYIYKDGKSTACSMCSGTGFNTHTSTQDIIFVPTSKYKEEQLSLDNMARYVTPEVALIEFQQQYLEYLTDECMQAVFNSEIFTRDEIATTATEKRIDLDNVYDTLYPLALKYAREWKFAVHTIAEIVEMTEGLVASLSFSKDFKFKSKDDYIRDRNNAKEAGTPDAILRNIDDEIMRIDTADNPMQFEMYKTVQSFDPFTGKTDEEVMAALTSNTVPLEIKVLYNNLGWIFDSIFLEDPEFFLKPRKEQVKVVDQKVQEIITKIKADQTQTPEFERSDQNTGSVEA